MRHGLTLIASSALLLAAARGDPTWPSQIDELEEIMFHMMDFKTRNFADTILPCTNEASGPGRQNAAEWLRLGFHDMSTANVDQGIGGLDGSIQYELDTGESLGPGFQTTLEFMSGFYTSRSSIADLIALGVYASVRSCGGLPVPIRTGRIDAPGPGPLGVPQPEHSVEMFRETFRRMGFSPTEMIQVTACGHTIGGVHDTEFPELVVAGEAPSDTTVAGFDEKVITEYLEDNTTNPLVVGPAVGYGKDSDAKIFGSDGNATVTAMADPDAFQRVCQQVLQKMIDVVPPGVVLTDPVRPYMVKPVDLQLALSKGASRMLFTGHIRVKTTDLPFDDIDHIRLDYRDRNGGTNCGGSCSIKATGRGTGYGLDDSFGFFPIEATIPTESGISSFTVTLTLTNGTTLFFDNNGQSYPLQDAIMLMHPQSCLIQHTGQTSVTAAVRNDRAHLPTYLFVSYKVPREGLPVAGLHNMTMSMKKGECVGAYTLYSASWMIPGGISHSARIDVISGDAKAGHSVIADSFKHAVELPGTCQDFSGPPASMCTTLAVVAPSSTAVGLSAAPTTMMTKTTVAATPTSLSSQYTAAPADPDDGKGEVDKFGLTHAVTNFVGYWVNYAVNYFWGYDRFQMVNHQFDRVT